MNNQKLQAIKSIIKSKLFIVVTDTESYLWGNMKNMEGIMAVNALRSVKAEITELLSGWEDSLKKTRKGKKSDKQ